MATNLSGNRFGKDRRVNASLVGKIVRMASRLQIQHDETLTHGQIESIGKEIGLEPSFIEQALHQLDESAPARKTSPQRLKLWMTSLAFTLPVLWGILGLILVSSNLHGFANPFAWITTLPMIVLTAFLAGKKDLGNLAAMELVVALSPAMQGGWLPYAIVAWIFGSKLVEVGVNLREEYLPLSRPASGDGDKVSRKDLMNLMVRLETELQQQMRRRTFLSVDVVNSTAMSQSADAREIEFIFTKYQTWLEIIVKSNGGKVVSAAGDGAMCAFEEDRDALRAARQIQSAVEQFNSAHNRLPMPFQLRCGICSGDVALEKGVPLSETQSPVMYRAAMLQKRAQPGGIVIGEELRIAAATELPPLTPLPDALNEVEAYSVPPLVSSGASLSDLATEVLLPPPAPAPPQVTQPTQTTVTPPN